MKQIFWVAISALVGSVGGAVVMAATAPPPPPPALSPSATIPYHGKLLKSGTPMDGVTVSVHAQIYDAPTGGTLLWQETQTGIAVSGGEFSLQLGAVTPLTGADLGPGDRYLAIGIDDGSGAGVVALTGRQLLGAVPFAWRGAPGQDFTVSGRLYDKTGLAGIPGQVMMYGGATAPAGWLPCDGSAVSRTQYPDLFAAIGITYGAGDTSTTFNVPDFRGIFPRGAGTNGTLTKADGNSFTTTAGAYQNDAFQEHKFEYRQYMHVAKDTSSTREATGENWASGQGGVYDTSPPVADQKGTPRTAGETRPANLGINFVIKY